MEMRQLESFVRIVQYGSFTRAAEILYLSQPAVTRQISVLEAELDTRLLERIGKKVTLTDSGNALYRYAWEILRLANEARQEVTDTLIGNLCSLRIGANSSTAAYILPQILQRFREEFPGVELSIHTGVSSKIAEMVTSNVVDIGLVSHYEAGSIFISLDLLEEETVVVTYPDHPLAAGQRVVRPDDLAGASLILMEPGTSLRAHVDKIFSESGVVKKLAMELDNVEAIKKMIVFRMGISLLPLIAVQEETRRGELIAMPLEGIPSSERKIIAIYHKDKYLSKALIGFLQILKRIDSNCYTISPIQQTLS